jgi:hypothetical protein
MFTDPGNWGRDNWRLLLEFGSDGLYRIGLVIALALFLASHFPLPLVPLVLSGALQASAFVTGVFAMLRGEDGQAKRLTLWDEAALLTLLGLTAKAFVSQEALRTIVCSDGLCGS